MNLAKNFDFVYAYPVRLAPLGKSHFWPLKTHFFENFGFYGLRRPKVLLFPSTRSLKAIPVSKHGQKAKFHFLEFLALSGVPNFKTAVEMVKKISESQNMSWMAGNELNFMNLGQKRKKRKKS